MKRKYYLFALLFLLCLGSCKKYLETKPTDFLNPDNYYETKDQLQFARAGVYSILGAPQLYGTNAIYTLGWEGDGAFFNRGHLLVGPWSYFYNPGEVNNTGLWGILFNGINRANMVLANLDKSSTVSKTDKDVLRGEMLFLRGYYYFMLAQYYGEVPLKTSPTVSINDLHIAKSSIKEVYAQILKDMEAAETLVPGIASLGYGGAVSKSAVRGLLARVNLFMAGEPLKDKTRYAEASKWAKKVIDDAESGHALNSNYPQIFMNLAGDKYDIKESIWEVEFWGNLTNQFQETTVNGWMNGIPSGANNSNTGKSDAYLNITSKYYDVFENGDNRKWFTIAHFSYPNSPVPNGTKTLTGLPATQNAKNMMKPGKWRREYETFLPKAAARTPQNVPLLRYSDILLMYAEAENEINGPTIEAIEAVNKVRRRAWSSGIKNIVISNGGSGYTTVPTVTITGGGAGSAVATTTSSAGAAAASATISGGRITAINLNRDISGIRYFQEGEYTTLPTITITGGGGSGARATATIYSKNDANLPLSHTSSKESFFDAIKDERMREFAFENLRKGDLLRWGIFLNVMQDMGNTLQQESPGQYFVDFFKNVGTKDLLMPIPTIELSTNNKITQNPGWN